MCVSFLSCSGVRVPRAQEVNQPARPPQPFWYDAFPNQGLTRPLPPSLPSQKVVVVTDADVLPLFVSELLAGRLCRDGFEVAFPRCAG
jgi:hypothetical protein